MRHTARLPDLRLDRLTETVGWISPVLTGARSGSLSPTEHRVPNDELRSPLGPAGSAYGAVPYALFCSPFRAIEPARTEPGDAGCVRTRGACTSASSRRISISRGRFSALRVASPASSVTTPRPSFPRPRDAHVAGRQWPLPAGPRRAAPPPRPPKAQRGGQRGRLRDVSSRTALDAPHPEPHPGCGRMHRRAAGSDLVVANRTHNHQLSMDQVFRGLR